MKSTFLSKEYLGVSHSMGSFFGGSHNQDSSILGSILGSPVLGNYDIRFHVRLGSVHSWVGSAVTAEQS